MTVESTVGAPPAHGQEAWDAWPDLAPGEAAARFDAARRRGEPAWPWPEMERAAWRGSLRVLERAASALLAGTRRVVLPVPAGGRDGVLALSLAAYTSGLGPWLGAQLEGGSLHADGDVARCLAVHLDHSRRRWVRLDAALNEVLAALSGTCSPVVLKGAHTARRYFAEPALRPMSDLDVYVGMAAVSAAESALAAAGFAEHRGRRRRSPHRSEWRAPGAPLELRSLLYCHAEDPFDIDLHGSADIDFFGVARVPFDAVFPHHAEPAPWSRDAGVPRQPLLAAHLAVHASHGLHGLTLIRLLELVLVLRADMRGPGDWNDLRDVLRMLEAERFAWPALALAERLAPGTVDADTLRACAAAAPPRLRRFVDGIEPHEAQRLHGLALGERFIWCNGAGEHVRRAVHMALPGGTRARLASIYATRAWRLVRGRVSLRA